MRNTELNSLTAIIQLLRNIAGYNQSQQIYRKLSEPIAYLDKLRTNIQNITKASEYYEVKEQYPQQLQQIIELLKYSSTTLKKYKTSAYKQVNKPKLLVMMKDAIEYAESCSSISECLENTLKENEQLKGEIVKLKNALPILTQQQLAAIEQVENSVVNGQITKMFYYEKYTFKRGDTYVQLENHWKPNGLPEKFLQSLLSQSFKIKQLINMLAKQNKSDSNPNDLRIALSERLKVELDKSRTISNTEIQKLNEVIKVNVSDQKKRDLHTAQNLILNDKFSSQKYRPQKIPFAEAEQLFEPLLKQKAKMLQVEQKLSEMAEVVFSNYDKQYGTIADRILIAINKLQKMISQNANKYFTEANSIKANTQTTKLSALLTAFNSWKTIQKNQQKIEKQEIMREVQKEIVIKIGQNATTSWKQFRQKYQVYLRQKQQKVPSHQHIISETIKMIGKALQIPTNTNFFEFLQNKNTQPVSSVRGQNVRYETNNNRNSSGMGAAKQQSNIIILQLNKRITQLQSEIIKWKNNFQQVKNNSDYYFKRNKQLSQQLQTVNKNFNKLKESAQQTTQLIERKMTQKDQSDRNLKNAIGHKEEDKMAKKNARISELEQYNTLMQAELVEVTQKWHQSDNISKQVQLQYVSLQSEVNEVLGKANNLFNQKSQNAMIENVKTMYEIMQNKIMEYRNQRNELRINNEKLIKQKEFYSALQQKFIGNMRLTLGNDTLKNLDDIENELSSRNQQEQSNNKMQGKQNKEFDSSLMEKIWKIYAKMGLKIEQQTNQKKDISQIEQMTELLSAISRQVSSKAASLKLEDHSQLVTDTQTEKFILEKLANYTQSFGQRISRFNLIFRSSRPLRNIDQVLSKQPNTLLIIKTMQGHIIGCYSSRSYCQTKDYKESKGMLISTYSKVAYPLKRSFSPVSQSQQNLIFGNGTIKLSKTVSDKIMVSLDFGYNSAFDCVVNKTKHVEQNISGVSDKQVPIQGFQIYQLEFGDSKNEILDIIPQKSSPVKQESNRVLIQRHGQMTQPKKSDNQAVNVSQPIGGARNMSVQKQERMYKQLKQKNQQFKRVIDTLKKRESQLTKELQMYKKATPQGNCSQNSEVTPNPNQQALNDQNIAQSMTTPSPPSFSIDQIKLAQIKKQLDQKEILHQKQLISFNQLSKRAEIAEQESKSLCDKLKKSEQQCRGLKQQLQKLQNEKQSHINTKEAVDRIKKIKQTLLVKIRELWMSEIQKQKQFIREFILNEMKRNLQMLEGYCKQIYYKIGGQESLQKDELQEPKNKVQTLQRQLKNSPQYCFNVPVVEMVDNAGNGIQDKTSIKQAQIPDKLERFKTVQVLKQGLPINEAKSDSMNVQSSQQSSQLISIADQIKKGKSIIEKLKEKQTKYQKIVKQIEQKISELNQKFNEKQNDILTINLQFEGLAEKSEKVKQITEQLKRLEAQICQKNKEMQDIDQALFEAKRNQQKTLKAILQQESTDLKRIRDQTKQAKLEQERIMKDNMSKENAELEKIKDQSKKQKEDLEKLKQKTKEYTKKKDELEKQNRAKTTQFNSIIDKLRLVEADLERLSKQRDEIAALKNSINQKYQQKSRIDSELRSLQYKISNLQREEQNRQANIRQIREQIAQLQKQKKQYQQIKANIEQVQRQHRQWLQKVEALTQVYENTKKQVQQVQQDIRNNNQQATRTKKINQDLLKQRQQLLQQLQRTQKKLLQSKSSIQKQNTYPNRHFIGQVLQQESDRDFILEQLTSLYPKRTIMKTKLLFSLSLIPKQNAHQYVDNKQCYLTIMKLRNTNKYGKNFILCFYSQLPLCSNKVANNGKGFVAAVTNRKVFGLKNNPMHNPRWTQYSDFYFVYGNSEIRFSMCSHVLETNIGHNYKSLDTGQMKDPKIFTGSEQSTAEIEDYEIYQIEFDGPI